MTSSQAGHRALSLPVNVITLSTPYSTFIKATGCTGILHLLLLGILLPLVSGQTSSTSAASMPSALTTADPTATATAPASAASVATTVTSNTGGTAASNPQPSTTATSGATATSMTQSGSSMPTSSTDSSTSMMYTSQPSNSGGTSSTNGATTSSSMSMIYCPSFICNYSDCNTMYASQNATSCSADGYCQLIRQRDMCYNVSCSASCAESCVNTTQTDCSMDCCNSTGCLNSTFASMMMTTTTVTTETTTTTVTTSASTSPPVNNGNKCHKGSCTGAACYESFRNQGLQTCSSSQPHCQLKKETVNSNLQWMAGCTTNCSGQTPCKASTQPPCHLECCNATVASCLWLNGTLNVPSFATRGPHLNTEFIASTLFLLVTVFLR